MKITRIGGDLKDQNAGKSSLVLPNMEQQAKEDKEWEIRWERDQQASEDVHNMIEKMPSNFRQPILLYLEALNRVDYLTELQHYFLVRLRFFERKKIKPIGETYRQRVDRLLAEWLASNSEDTEVKNDGI